MLKTLEPIQTIALFPELSSELTNLLKGLPSADWLKPTACTGWCIKDVAAHLLGGNLSRLSFHRDRYFPPGMPMLTEYDEILNFINQKNWQWVEAARAFSPGLLIEWLERTDNQLYQFFKTLPPDAPAIVPVSWAGEADSLNWFDIAREYTEKWLHQQHIRQAAGQSLLLERKWFFPILDTFLRALPYAYRDVNADEGTILSFCIRGEAGGEWSLCRQDKVWRLFSGVDSQPACRVEIDPDLAWRLFTRGVEPQEARTQALVTGDQTLGEGILHMISIMA